MWRGTSPCGIVRYMPHIHDLIDFTVAAFIVNRGRVLLVNHKKLHKWLPVGGHIELDEDPNQALFREILEESGIPAGRLTLMTAAPDIESEGTTFLPTPSFLDIHEISDGHRHVGMIYFLRSSTADVALAEREHDGIRWFTLEDVDDPSYGLSNAIRYYAHAAIATCA